MDGKPVHVWDFPTRLFHWSIVLLFGFSWWSAETGQMDWHRLSGTVVLGLVAFRLIWGLIGGSTARFANFLKSPGRVIAYMRGGSRDASAPGHNPLGGYSVIILLLLLAAQVASGLFAVDTDGLESGPLSYLVSFDQGRAASELHELSFNILLALTGIHILAIVFYRFVRGRNLVSPMLTGRDPQVASGKGALIPASPISLVVAAAVAAAFAWWISKGMVL
jgi:cytochrome b